METPEIPQPHHLEKYFHIFLLLFFAIFIPPFISPASPVKAEQATDSAVLEAPQPITTQSKFGYKLETTKTTLPRQTITKNDPDTEYGEEKVLTEGSDGTKTVTTRIAFYEGQEYSREVDSTDIVPPVDKVVVTGTKIVWRTLDTPDGQIKYWRKLHVYATHYDSHCPGCNDWTATGMHQGKGVIAVDPKVIKLYTHAYVPGYGPAVAGDTGGAIKGNIIDLGFVDAQTAGWYAHYVDIYLMDKAPE